MRELVQTAESFTREFKFDYSTIIWKEDGHFFRSTLPERILLRKSVDIDNLPISEPIPIHLIRGLWHNGLTEVSNPPSDYFVKVPALLSYHTLPLGEITAAEADICEILKRNPYAFTMDAHARENTLGVSALNGTGAIFTTRWRLVGPSIVVQ
jgi:hypothetical protein